MDEIREYDYDNLLLLVAKGDFYKYINTPDKLEEFVNLLHLAYCKKHKIKPTQISFDPEAGENAYGAYSENKNLIFLNPMFKFIFNHCMQTNNKAFPLMLTTTIVHESRHYWQSKNTKKMYSKKTSKRERLSLYSFHKRTTRVKKALKRPRRSIFPMYNFVKQSIRDLNIALLGVELQMEYANSPVELDAEEEAMEALVYMYDKSESEEVLKYLLNYGDKIKNNRGVWFLPNEYREDKNKPYDRRSFPIIKFFHDDYEKNYSKEMLSCEYVLRMYPAIWSTIEQIKEMDDDIPENVDGYEEVKGYLLESPLAFKRK